uniref:Uncharacterized protein n=1 Tax=Synechococcus sp. PCC 9341 TaxID=2099386 RepID=A0A2P0ZGE9_9SYNE|nr:hypothetical protein [Synechococcus sp. PCC 9341]
MTKISIVDLHPIDVQNLNYSDSLTDQECDLIKGGNVRAVVRAFRVGYRIGQWLNDNTRIQEYIREGLDRFDERLRDWDGR